MRLDGRGISVSVLLVVGFAAWSNLDGLAVRFGGTFGIPVSKYTFLLPAALKLGLSDPVPEATAGPLVWAKAQDGFDVPWLGSILPSIASRSWTSRAAKGISKTGCAILVRS